MQLCIEQHCTESNYKYYLVLPFFCTAKIYRPSLGKVQLGRPKMYRLGGDLNSVVC